ncbi:MAG TPA: aminotransferase class IV [Pirellulales bacterium]|jgi:branched-subunit amino acid aminotransferase/4-amino-4-deoxychorismate lyase|nr:aminotransferase class IV [Pirellulales bacterium]
MPEPIAYLNGKMLPAREAAIPVDDAGFALGTTITEQLRTFGGRLFRADRHFERLANSLAICGIEAGLKREDFGRIAQELVERNYPLVELGDDLGLCVFVTPGAYAAISSGRRSGPTVGLHTFPLAFELWAARYAEGVSLVVTAVEQVSQHCWPAELKCRSRMHYYLADRQAEAIERGARALLLDAQGNVTESSTANLVIYVSGQGLVGPPRSDVLPGVSLEVAIELARGLSIPYSERRLLPADVATAGEVFLTSTPNCLLPVVRFAGRAIGDGHPGPVFRKISEAWNGLVGLDIAAQAVRFSRRYGK